jgi:regulator of cell morphogenesis and NO signaling
MKTLAKEYDITDLSVAEIALRFPNALEILDRFNLDYCCNGRDLFADACEKSGLNPDAILLQIQQTDTNSTESGIRFDTWDTSLLIDFIVQHHHAYIKEAIPKIKELLNKVCNVHSDDSPFLVIIRENFNDLAEELMNHLPKEEEYLFPAIRKIMNGAYPECDASAIENSLGAPIAVMESEHKRAGELIKSIRYQTRNYTLPGHACPTFKLTYTMLDHFEKNLIQHIHLENNVLFPRVINSGVPC